MVNSFKTLNKEQMIEGLNFLGGKDIPFLFVVDYKAEKGFISKISDLKNTDVFCAIKGVELNSSYQPLSPGCCELEVSPISFAEYENAFDKALVEIRNGNTYLLNLTFATDLGLNLDLKHIYAKATAPYKMLFDNNFVFYSPESFIKISDNKIYSFPMKGTIDASKENAAELLLNDDKERYEHNTIVDLIRNDLSMISRGVVVEKFRYIDHIKTSKGEILQTSSQICGNLESDWKSKFGDILFTMLPAGSITGAPKQKTLEVIEDCEVSERGFYCGVMVFFDGVNIDSCVNIRFIERKGDGRFYYRSGGGITALSKARDEYEELIKKVYVPII